MQRKSYPRGHHASLTSYNKVHLSWEKVVFWETSHKPSLRSGSREFIVVEGREPTHLSMEKSGYFFIQLSITQLSPRKT